MKITIAAPAKVNLWLRVGPPQPTGYHDLSTLFCALDLADTVVLRKRKTGRDTELEVRAAPPLPAVPDLGPVEANLAVRAARSFVERSGSADPVHIELVKRIPTGGGLGGGSSDAGAVLRALRRLYPRALGVDELLEIATAVGSDVPFFLQGTPLAHGAGRGEELTPLRPLPPRPVVLIIPPFPVATAEAYRWLDQDRGESASSGATAPITEYGPAGSGLTWEQVGERAVNDFEAPVFGRLPELGALRDELRTRGARPALLAGSGSTVFGVFSDGQAAHEAARGMRAEYPDHRVVVTGTRTR